MLLLLVLVHKSAQQTCYNPILTDSPGWVVEDGTPFDLGYACGLRADHVSVGSGLITLTIDNSGCPGSCSNLPLACGEMAAVVSMFDNIFVTALILMKLLSTGFIIVQLCLLEYLEQVSLLYTMTDH